MKLSGPIVETVSSSVLYPLLCFQQAIIVPVVGWFEHRATMHELRHSLAQLRTINEQLYAENSALKASHVYADETAELRAFNRRYESCKGKTHMVQVLARHFSLTEQFFLVDAGSSQGIKKDMVALYCNNIVGKVTQVYPWYCKVCLITDVDCKVAATCVSIPALASPLGKVEPALRSSQSEVGTALRSSQSEVGKKVNGIHEGCNDALRTTLRYVSHLESVDVHDTVISSGEGLVFPKGFALGKVIQAHKGELFYAITVQPLLDLQTLNYCTLVAKEDI